MSDFVNTWRLSEADLSARVPKFNKKPIAISASTRGIGFGTQFLANSCKMYNSSRRGLDIPDIHAMYRSFLGIFEAKLQEFNYGCFLNPSRLTMDFMSIARLVVKLPFPINIIVSTVGEFTQNGTLYFPYIPAEFIKTGQFVPEPEFVTLSNLRKVVDSLSNPDTLPEYRAIFRQKNPIPGTRWSEDNILLNPDDIIGPSYTAKDFREDTYCIMPLVNFLETYVGRMKGGPNDNIKKQGKKSIFLSNNSSYLRQPELIGAKTSETIADLIEKLPIGDIDLFWSLFSMSKSESIEGIVCLLGESSSCNSNIQSLNPLRSEAVCSHVLSYSYQCAYMMACQL